MAIVSEYCAVLGAHISRVTDLAGATNKIICPEYQASDGVCRRLKDAKQGGPLSQLLERVSEDALRTKDVHCIFR
jgi:hypothetical protein